MNYQGNDNVIPFMKQATKPSSEKVTKAKHETQNKSFGNSNRTHLLLFFQLSEQNLCHVLRNTLILFLSLQSLFDSKIRSDMRNGSVSCERKSLTKSI